MIYEKPAFIIAFLCIKESKIKNNFSPGTDTQNC